MNIKKSMKIRKATSEDLQQVYLLAKELSTSFDVKKDAFKKIYPEMIADTKITLLVAEIENQIIGYCLAFHHLTFYANGYVTWIEETIVNKNYHSIGIGSKLIQEIEQSAKGMHSKLVALATRRAESFYKKLDYKESAKYFNKYI